MVVLTQQPSLSPAAEKRQEGFGNANAPGALFDGSKPLHLSEKAADKGDADPLIFEPSKEVLTLSQKGGITSVVMAVIVTLFASLVIVLPLVLILAFIYVSWTRIPIAAYVAFCFIDPAIDNGFGRPLQQARALWVWKYINAYYPARMVLEKRLDPSLSYIFGVSPHGILCFSGQVVRGSLESGLDEALDGITFHTAALHHVLKVPLFREYLLSIGTISSSRKSIRNCLARGNGHSVGIVIGGAKESLHTNRGNRKLILKNRKGFVREAILAGAPLVPIFVFGENDIFQQLDHPLLRHLQSWLQRKMKFAIPFFYGNFLVVPRRVPLTVVFGRPIFVEKSSSPSFDDINKIHAEYLSELTRLYNRFKPIYDPDGDDLIIV